MSKLRFVSLLIVLAGWIGAHAVIGAIDANDVVIRELIFKSDFGKNPGLKNWYDVNKWLPENSDKNNPDLKWYKVVTENDETFLRTSTMFGVSSLLKPKVVVDDSVVQIELIVTLRKPQDGQLVQIALTSRNDPSGKDGGPFWEGRHDSGIIASGYQHDIQSSNLIAWQKDGRRVQMPVQKPPFNLLSDRGKWVIWRLIYKHSEKQLCFYKNIEDEEPFVIQRNVDLTESTLNSVWISAWGTEYSNIEVYCTRKASK